MGAQKNHLTRLHSVKLHSWKHRALLRGNPPSSATPWPWPFELVQRGPQKNRKIFHQDETVTQPENSGRLVHVLFFFPMLLPFPPSFVYPLFSVSCHQCSIRSVRRFRPVILLNFPWSVPPLGQIKVTRSCKDYRTMFWKPGRVLENCLGLFKTRQPKEKNCART